MRRFLALISVAGLAMALATSAQAAPFSGTVSFGLSTLTPLVASGSGSGTSAPGLLTIATTSWAVAGPTQITLAPTAAAPLTALNVLLVGPGPCTFTGIPVRGPCALGGTANGLVGGAPFLVVPLSGLGVAGRQFFGPYGSYIDAQSWVAATATPTVAGAPVLDDYGVPFYTLGYDARTPGGAGTIKLVAPAGLMSTLGGDLPLFASMTLYVPEPGTLLALCFSSAGLMVAGGLSSRRLRGSTRKRRALFSLLVILALGMVALWATSTLAGPFPPSSTTTTTTTITTLPPTPTGAIDIKPGSDPNSINLFGGGVISVAILTTEDFDALTVDADSVRFGPDEAEKRHKRAHVKDVDEDGDLDLLLHFRTQETGIAPGDTEACVIGQTYDGVPIMACDSVNTVPPN